MVLEKLNSVEEEPKNMGKDHYSLKVCLKTTQKELERDSGELREKDVLTDSLQKAAKAGQRDGRGQGRPGETMERRQYEIVCTNAFRALHGMCTIEY